MGVYAAAVRLPVLAAQPIARAGYLSGAFLFSPPLRLGRRLQLLQRFKEGKALEAWRLPSPILRRSPLRHARRRQTVAASSSASGGSFSRVRVSHRDCNRCYRLPVNGRSAEGEKLFSRPASRGGARPCKRRHSDAQICSAWRRLLRQQGKICPALRSAARRHGRCAIQLRAMFVP